MTKTNYSKATDTSECARADRLENAATQAMILLNVINERLGTGWHHADQCTVIADRLRAELIKPI